MGTYLDIGIATKIYARKEDRWRSYSKEEVLENLGKKIDLNIYNMTDEEDYVILDIKPEIFEKEIGNILSEQLKYCENAEEEMKKIDKLKGLSYNELIDIAEEKSMINFCLMEGADISYIADRIEVYCDFISILSEGKVFFECYYNMFNYIRNLLVATSKNPLKTAQIITISG